MCVADVKRWGGFIDEYLDTLTRDAGGCALVMRAGERKMSVRTPSPDINLWHAEGEFSHPGS